MASINLSGSPVGPRPQTKMRIEMIARYRLAGIRNSKIADVLGITEAALGQILQMPEYKETEEALLLGMTTKMDEALAGKVDILRQSMRTAVPSALRAVLDTVNQRRDLRAALAAAGEILDRDPDKTFLKAKDQATLGETETGVPNVIWGAAVAEGEKVEQALKDEKKEKVN